MIEQREGYEGVGWYLVCADRVCADRVCADGVCVLFRRCVTSRCPLLTSISTVLASRESCRYTTVKIFNSSSVSPSPGPGPVASETRASAVGWASVKLALVLMSAKLARFFGECLGECEDECWVLFEEEDEDEVEDEDEDEAVEEGEEEDELYCDAKVLRHNNSRYL